MPDLKLPPRTSCLYQHLPDTDVHVLSYTESSRQAVDDMFQYVLDIDAAYRKMPRYEQYHIRLLVDNRGNPTQPLQTGYQGLDQVMKRLQDHPYQSVRLGILYSNMLLSGFVNTFFSASYVPRLHYRGFSNQEYDKALHWLVQ